VIRGSELVSERQLEDGCPLRISEALVMRSNSAVRATGAEHSRRFLRELDKAPGGNNLQYIYCSILTDGDQREFDHKTKVITNENRIISEMFHNCALNK